MRLTLPAAVAMSTAAMAASAAPPRWNPIAIALHWLLALMILVQLGVGAWMTGLEPSPIKIKVYGWHKATGLTLLALAALRLVWRATHRAPPLPPAMPRWQRRAAAASHALLYALLFALPLSGWLQNSAAGFPLSWFGLFKVPALIARDKTAFAFWQQTHELLAWMLATLIVLHVAAALKHHFVDRDDVLRRMLPRRRPAERSAR